MKKITIEITCKTKEAERELKETLSYFESDLLNIEGNVKGFKYKVTKTSKK